MEPLETRRLERGSGDSDLQLTASTSVVGADVENEPIPLATEVPLAVKKGRITILPVKSLRVASGKNLSDDINKAAMV